MCDFVRAWATALVTFPLLSLHLSCTGADPTLSDGPGDGGHGGAADGGGPPTTSLAAPASGPASLRFRNQEFREGFAEGRVRVRKADDESDVTEYVVYWGTTADVKAPGDPVAVLPRGPEEHVVVLAPGTPIPPGATHLLAFTRNANGEGPHVSASLANSPQFVDVSASVSAAAGFPFELRRVHALVDAARGRLLVVGETHVPDHWGMGTLACNLEATACSFNYACAGDDCGLIPRHALDDLNDKLLIAADSDRAGGLAGYVCARDGTACASSDKPGMRSVRSAPWVFVRPDSNDVVMLYVSQNATGINHLHATTCTADLAQCPTEHVDLDPLGGQIADDVSAIRLPNGKFAVAATAVNSDQRLSLYLTDGTQAGTTVYFATNEAKSGLYPAMALDTKNGRLVIVSTNVTRQSRLYLTLCSLEAKPCLSVDIGAGAPENSGNFPSVAIDDDNEKILVVSKDDAGGARPRLTRCNLDGTACSTTEFSAKRADTVYDSAAAIDTVNGYFLAVVNDADNKVGVIRWGL
jgi:hypothetical protein